MVGRAAAWVVPWSDEAEVGPLARVPSFLRCCSDGACEGADARYVGLFGRTELPERVPSPVIDLVGPSRALRQRLVQLASHHEAIEVHIDLGRDHASELLRDCLRLFGSVRAHPTGSMEGWTRRQRDAVEGVKGLD